MRAPMVVSRSSSARRSISSEIAFTCPSVLAAAICFRRDWAMTSSPTWSIRSSNRSAGTRMLPAMRGGTSGWGVAAGLASGDAADLPSAGATGLASAGATSVGAGGRSDTGSRSSCISSSTNRKTCSIAERGWTVVSVTSQPIWHSLGFSASSGGIVLVSATTVQGPSARNSSSNSNGLVPIAMASRGSRKPSRQVVADGCGGAIAGAPSAACRRSRMAAPSASSASSGCSISRRIWSFAASVTAISGGATATSPLRTRSNAVSTWCVKAATASKPNIAPDPLIVCRARNAVFTRSASSGRCSRSSKVARADPAGPRLPGGRSARDRCGSCAQHLAHHRQQLVLLERLGDPAGGAGRLGFAVSCRAADSVVRKMIGIPVHCGSRRSSRIIAMPFMTGMLRSVSTMSMPPPRALASPSAPLPACTTA